MNRHFGGLASFVGSVALVATFSSLCAAQDAATTQPDGGVIVSSNPVALPTTQPESRLISFNFKDADISAVLDYLATNAKFVVVPIVPVTGRVTMLSPTPITPEQAVVYLNSALKADGFIAIQMGNELKIDTLANAKKANIPVRFGEDPDQIEDTDQLITQVIPVRNVDAVKLKTDLAPMVSTDADLTANAASNTLIITDTSTNVRRVVSIIAGMDKHESAASDIRVKQLKYADATAAAKLIMDIFSPQETTQQASPFGNNPFFRLGGGGGAGGGGAGGGGGRFGGGGGFGGGGFGGGGFGGGPGGGAAAAAQQESGNTGHVEASADERTNTIVVSGPPDTLAIIDGVLTQLDSNPAAEQDFFIYRVKNGQAVDMASTLNGLFSGTTASSSTANRSQFSSGTGNRVSGSSGFGGGGGGGGGGGAFGGGGGGGSLGGSSFGSNSTLNAANRTLGSTSGGLTTGFGGGASASVNASNLTGVAQLIGQVYVVADQDTNSLLVATAAKYEKQVRDVIDQLDSRVQQVLIKVLIAEVTHANNLDFGTDFSLVDISRTGKEGTINSTLGAAAAAASTSTPGGMVVSLLENDVYLKLQALAQENRLDVLSRPYILTSDNQEADITVGSEVPFITNTFVNENGGITNSAQYQDIGIILTVTPHINPEGLVTMLVSPQISSLTDQTVTIQQGVSLPVFDVRSADSYLTVRDGQTVVIGGLMQDEKTENFNKIPLLGDIPVIGKLLFSYNTISKQKTELLIFLTPHVAAEPDTLRPMTNDEMRGLRLTPNAVEPGIFQEQLRGMQRGNASTQPSPMYIPPPTVQRDWMEPPQPGH